MSPEKERHPYFLLLESEVRFRIFSLLHIYPELSFSKISNLLNKSKSTLHPHLQKLIEIGLIEVSREEKVKGNFTRNYYSLKSGIFKELDYLDDLDENYLDNSIFILVKNWMKFIIKTIRLYEKYLETLESEENGMNILKEHLINQEALSGMFFFSESQFKKASKLTIEYLKMMEKIQNEGVVEEKPFYILALTLPVKQMIESQLIPKD